MLMSSLTGYAIHESISARLAAATTLTTWTLKSNSGCRSRRPGQITIVRNRMFFARPALNAKGVVRLGLRHIREFRKYISRIGHDLLFQMY